VLRLRTLGGLSIEQTDGAAPSSAATSARRRLALLAVLAVNAPRGVPRDKLLALFWPESDTDRARHALDQTLYSLKKDLGADALVVGREEPALNSAAITSDVEEFQAALARGDRAAAVELYRGPFLDGVFITGAPGFERWVDEERARITREVEFALESLATDAAGKGDHAGAVQRWQRLAVMEPRKTRVVLSLMTELAASGDRAGALRHAEIYHTLVRDDLEAEPNPAIAALADKLRREPAKTEAPRRTTDPRMPAPTVNAASVPPVPAPPRTSAPPSAPALHRETPLRLVVQKVKSHRVLGFAAGLLLLLGLTLAWVQKTRGRDTERAWILAADFDNRTHDPIFDRALDAALATGLQQSGYVSVFPRARIEQTLTRMGRTRQAATAAHLDEPLAREVAQREGIPSVVIGAIDRVDSSYMLTARIVDATSGSAIAAETRIASHRSDVIGAIDDLVRRLRRDIGESANAIAKHDLPLPQATTASLEALHKYADGLAAWRAGQRKAAVELYEEAVAIDSDFALAHAELGGDYYWNNDRPDGDAHFDHALRLLDRLTDRERLTVRATAESWRGNRAQAIELRRALLAIYPGDRSAWGKIGYDYMRLGRAQEAVTALRLQLARDSTSAGDYINLATAYKELAAYDSSIRYYKRAFKLQPNMLTLENLNHEYGETLVLAGKHGEARAVYDSMLVGDVDQQARGNRSLGLLAMVQGHYGEAIERFRQATFLSQAPNRELTEARNRLFLASAEQEKGWRDSASAQIRAAYALFRKAYFEPKFLVYLGKALVRDGQLPLAGEVLDTLRRRIRTDNPEDRSNLQILTGEIALAEGHPDSAVRALRVAYATDSSEYIRESLARAVGQSGDLRGAARLYESLAAATGGWYGYEAEQYGLVAPVNAAEAYERLGDQGRVRSLYERFLSQWPTADTDLVSMRKARDGLGKLKSFQLQRESRR
jgi:DNA-binding SARP family transcriptional activator/tetratricopeptide (TPR) repeat protein